MFLRNSLRTRSATSFTTSVHHWLDRYARGTASPKGHLHCLDDCFPVSLLPLHFTMDYYPSSKHSRLRYSYPYIMSRLPLALLLAASSLCAASAFAADCASLKSAALPEITITTAERTQGKLVPPYGDPIDKLPVFCRVAGVLHPTADSAIK